MTAHSHPLVTAATPLDGSVRAMMGMGAEEGGDGASALRRAAAAVAADLAATWPTRVFRLVATVEGVPADRERIVAALLEGLSGIPDPAADPRRRVAVHGLNRRMMAVRLAGATIAAFDPSRDLTCSGAAGRPALRITAHAAGAAPVERVLPL